MNLRQPAIDPALRHRLLTTASAAILGAAFPLGEQAFAADATASPRVETAGPQVQFDVIGQWSPVSGGAVVWGPPLPGSPDGPTIRPRAGYDIEGDLTVRPANSEWVLFGSVRYGHSGQGKGSFYQSYSSGYVSGKARHDEDHYMLDFEVGRDVGLGGMGKGATSVISGGVRFAHFSASTAATFVTATKYATTSGAAAIKRSSWAAGPVVSWRGSFPITDNGFSFRLGLSGAVLFGRESANVTTSDGSVVLSRSNTITVPAPSGYAAVGYRPLGSPWTVSVGYRVDAYFGVLDGGGITGRHDVDRVLAGPFIDFGLALR